MKKPKPPPPPPKNKSDGEGSSSSAKNAGVSTTTIIIAAAAGAGAFVLLVVLILVWCSCCRKRRNAVAHADLDVEYGGAAAAPPGAKFAADFQDGGSPALKPTRSHRVHALPATMLEPEDVALAGTGLALAAGGPLGGGFVAASGRAGSAPLASASGAGAASARRASPSRSAARSGASPSRRPPRPAAPPAPPLDADGAPDDALRTWGDDALVRELGSGRPSFASPARAASAPARRAPSVDISAYEIDFAALRVGRRVGEGSFGKVYAATWHETPVAVKVLVDESTALDGGGAGGAHALRSLSSPVMAALAAEAGLMASLRHPHIVQFMGICTLPPAVVTEYCARGSLADVLRAGRAARPGAAEALTWRRRLGMALDAATGMLHLHARSPPILHRDLKSPNLLVDDHWRVKVADFNMSRLVEESAGGAGGSSLAAMNPRWLAPEVLGGEGATAASDVYSFGIVLWELLTWELPWARDNPWAIVHLVTNGGRLEVPLRWDLPSAPGGDTAAFPGLADYLDLMAACWDQNPYARPAFGAVIAELRRLAALAPRGGAAASLGGADSPGDSARAEPSSDADAGADVGASIDSTAVMASAEGARGASRALDTRAGEWGS